MQVSFGRNLAYDQSGPTGPRERRVDGRFVPYARGQKPGPNDVADINSSYFWRGVNAGYDNLLTFLRRIHSEGFGDRPPFSVSTGGQGGFEVNVLVDSSRVSEKDFMALLTEIMAGRLNEERGIERLRQLVRKK